MSQSSSTEIYDPYAMPKGALREPPTSLWRALLKIGPGIILAGSIVGTGELLLTTSLGAEHGFVFLWLILFSCVVKVFVQVELGRYAISSGKPTLGALNDLPGPRLGAHWLVWWWFFMLLATVSQLGAMVGGVGQALNLAFPKTTETVNGWLINMLPAWAESLEKSPGQPWAVLTAVAAVILLLSGGYRRIEILTTALVASITLATVVGVIGLPFTGYPIRLSDLGEGFRFTLPAAGIAAAFGCFGITGVGASELYAYPYWCLEKGYARYAGACTPDQDWERRARGWMRVLHLDAWVSMLVFTVATVCFYFMGATVLHRKGVHPKGEAMMDQLSQMYLHFGDWTKIVFLVGACAVLFKTLYVASAGHSRLSADFLSMLKLVRYRDAAHRARYVRMFSVFFPAFALLLYLIYVEPRAMVVFGGFAQALTLPVITAATIYLRFRRTDKRLVTSWLSSACLWFAMVSISVVSAYATFDTAKNKAWPAIQELISPAKKTP